MKKKILITAGGLMVCAAVAIGINLSAKAKMSSLLMENIEALTGDEENECYQTYGYCGDYDMGYKCTDDETAESCYRYQEGCGC